MNDDFERRVAALFGEQVDHELRRAGAARSGRGAGGAGPWAARRRATRWLPLLAAACVVLVGAGAYGTSQLLSAPAPADRTSVVPGPTPSHASTAPTVAPTAAPSTVATRATSSPTTVAASSPSRHQPSAATSRPTHRTPTRPPSRTATHVAPPAGPPATAVVVLRPVRADGTPAPGWTVRADDSTSVTCQDGPSPVAVDRDIRFCGDSADGTPACWRAADHTHVLCLSDPYTRTLRRVTLTQTFAPVAATAHPVPEGLTLDTGLRYLARDGGAWTSVEQHPSWVGYYFQRTTFATNVYGPVGGTGIDTSTSRWSVEVFASSGAGVGHRHRVVTAYELGTAR